MGGLKWGSLRIRLVVLVLVAALPALGLTLYSGIEDRQNAVNKAREQVLAIARHASQMQQRYIASARQTLFTLCQLSRLHRREAGPTAVVLSQVLKNSQMFSAFLATRPDGLVFASAPRKKSRINLGDRPYFKLLLKTKKFVIGHYIIGRITGRSVLSLAHPVKSPAGRLEAVLVTGLKLDWLDRYFAGMKLPADTHLAVIDRHGRVLVHLPEHRGMIGRNVKDLAITRLVLKRRQGVVQAPGFAGRPRLFAFTSLGRSRQVYILIGVSTEKAFAPVIRKTIRNLVLLGIVFALALLAAWFGGSALVGRPVERLLEFTRQATEGNLSVRVGPQYSSGELGNLGRGFDRMAESLAKRHELQAVISGLLQKALTGETVEEVARTCLDSAIEFVGCGFGFIGELNDRGRFDTLSLSDPGWEACRMPDSEALVSINDMEVRGLWGRVITDGTSLLTNDPDSHSDRVGVPEGHPPLTSFLGVPLVQAGRTMGMIALANKKGGFDQSDREDMELLSEALVEALMRKRAEVELRRHRDQLETMVQERVKEQRCLYNISEVTQRGKTPFEEVLARVPSRLPPGWRYPEITCARVVYEDQEYATDNFRETEWSLSAPIYVYGQQSGLVQICYLEEKPAQYQGPFLKEETELIEEVAGRLGGLIGQRLAERQRRRSEEALRQSEANYRSIFDGAEDVIFIHDLTDGRILDVNRKVEELFGYSRDEALQLTVDDLGAGHEPYTLADAVKLFQKAVQEGPQVVEWQCRHKDGRLFWTENSLKMADIGGERRLLAVLRDISDRKQTEAALEYERAQLLALFEGIEDVMYVSDPETYELLYVNPTLRQIWGDDIIGQKCYAVLQKRDAPCPFCTNDIVFGEKFGQTHVWEFQNEVTGKWYRCADKAIKWADGRMVHFEIASDISESKKLEQERAELLSEMEGKNAELERFTYTVSHDLKSPLITIKGFMGLLEQDAVAGDTDRLKDDVARITAAVEKMSLLLEELLELSRIGRLMNPPEDVPLGELVQEAVEMVEGVIKERGVEVSVQPDLPVVHGDRVRLREVLENLVSNAAKFMGDQAAPKIEIGISREDREPVFFVRDNGIGISPQYHTKIFELFEQLEQGVQGTGIGLALVKRIVEVHGGRIWVDSAGANRGTTFYFTLSGSEKEKE